MSSTLAPRWRDFWIPCFLLLLATVLVYGQIVTFSFVNWDDPRYVYRNPVLLYPERLTLWQRWFPSYFGYPLPLTLLSYRIDQWIFGVPKPDQLNMSLGWGYHVTNLLLWVIIVFLVYRLCWLLSRNLWAALAGAMLFTLHPTNAETVAWVTGRKELLVTLWSLLCILGLRRYLERPSWKRAAWVGVCAMAALLSKPNAIFLLPLGLWMWWMLRDDRIVTSIDAPEKAQPSGLSDAPMLNSMPTKPWSVSKSWLPLAVVGLIFGLACLGSVALSTHWQHQLGAIETSRSWLMILYRALWALGYHTRLFWYPVDLRVKYIEEPGSFDIYPLLGLCSLLGLLWLIVHPRTRRSVAGLGAIVWITAYLPVSNLMPLRRFIADTYLFLPMIGAALLLTSLVTYLQHQGSSWRYRGVWGLLSATGILLAVLTFQQVRVWQDAPSLWEHTYRYHPNSPQVCRMLGFAYNETQRLQKAARTYEMCIRRFGPTLYQNNLAITYLLLKEWSKAKMRFEQILRHNPSDQRARYYLYIIAQEMKKPDVSGNRPHTQRTKTPPIKRRPLRE